MDRRTFLENAATAAALAAGDVSDVELNTQADHLFALADRDESDRWAYTTEANLASVKSGLVNANLENLCAHPDGTLQTYAVDSNGIPLGFEVSTDDGERVGTLVHLSAEQAEGLAVDLLEQAHAYRGDGSDGDLGAE